MPRFKDTEIFQLGLKLREETLEGSKQVLEQANKTLTGAQHLLLATHTQDVELTHWLVSQGMKRKLKGDLASEAHGAALTGDAQHVELATKRGVTWFEHKKAGWPIELAAKRGHGQVVETILAAEPVHDVFDQNQGYTELLTSTHTFANAELAALYGIEDGPAGAEFERVELDATRRSGILTRLGFLMSRAYQIDPDPIHRGAFISFELLCNPQPALPDEVTAVETDPTKTNRERVDDHTGDGTCGAVCHSTLINPAGFAFENYDAIGAYRTMDNGQPVNAKDEFAVDGQLQQFDNAVDFSNIIADSKQAHDCYTRHLLEYLYGRDHRDADDEAIDALGTESVEGSMAVVDLLTELVTTDEFVHIRVLQEGA